MTLEEDLQRLGERHGIQAFCLVFLQKRYKGKWYPGAPCSVECLSGNQFAPGSPEKEEDMADRVTDAFNDWLDSLNIGLRVE